MLVTVTPSAVVQNVLIRSVSRQSTAMAARRLVTQGQPFIGGNGCLRWYGRAGLEGGNFVVPAVARARMSGRGGSLPTGSGGPNPRPAPRLEVLVLSNSTKIGSCDVSPRASSPVDDTKSPMLKYRAPKTRVGRRALVGVRGLAAASDICRVRFRGIGSSIPPVGSLLRLGGPLV